MRQSNMIEVTTPFGVLCAEAGGDPAEYPEIFLYLRRSDGAEIDLCCASMDIMNNRMNAFLYGDTSTECWTQKHSWSEKEINIEYDNLCQGGANEYTKASSKI